MQQYIWARWLEIAVENELRSRHLLNQMLSNRETNLLLEEYRSGLVAVTSAAFAIEALYNEIEYLVPAQKSRGARHKDLRHTFRIAFGINQPEDSRLANDLKALFDLRNEAVHAYAEIAPPRRHPAGHNTGAENSLFNGLTAGMSVDLAMRLHTIASAPPNPHSRWVERWSETRTNAGAVAALREQRSAADPLSLRQRDLRWPTSP
ncbi:MAG: hypothetical protein P8J50_02450 [Acidimicrobiales bacterium]|nr:hypothetical protein [Acidimicrobiales bacterium]